MSLAIHTLFLETIKQLPGSSLLLARPGKVNNNLICLNYWMNELKTILCGVLSLMISYWYKCTCMCNLCLSVSPMHSSQARLSRRLHGWHRRWSIGCRTRNILFGQESWHFIPFWPINQLAPSVVSADVALYCSSWEGGAVHGSPELPALRIRKVRFPLGEHFGSLRSWFCGCWCGGSQGLPADQGAGGGGLEFIWRHHPRETHRLHPSLRLSGARHPCHRRPLLKETDHCHDHQWEWEWEKKGKWRWHRTIWWRWRVSGGVCACGGQGQHQH